MHLLGVDPDFVSLVSDIYSDSSTEILCKEGRTDPIPIKSGAAKSRIAPLRGITMPRMELLTAVIRDGKFHHQNFIQWETIQKYFRSDSTSVVTWLLREENWSVFVRKRVQEIKYLSNLISEKQVPERRTQQIYPQLAARQNILFPQNGSRVLRG
ncbi:hypothetical protein NPIL_616981 [Nephila pilipes]|uniref:Uncharacterized protein n=1 Tax=Nephila pilipes TaxID=299642 RepID=A0A8X6IB81_NEPPI|nr:hypothetical protein NPIL_616981 [Nephila pilipes]